jgi:hypothetical protein
MECNERRLSAASHALAVYTRRLFYCIVLQNSVDYVTIILSLIGARALATYKLPNIQGIPRECAVRYAPFCLRGVSIWSRLLIPTCFYFRLVYNLLDHKFGLQFAGKNRYAGVNHSLAVFV